MVEVKGVLGLLHQVLWGEREKRRKGRSRWWSWCDVTLCKHEYMYLCICTAECAYVWVHVYVHTGSMQCVHVMISLRLIAM